MKTVAIINLKGGVAKTTTAVSLAELLAEGDKRRKRPGSRVLLFDNDKQGNASRIFGAYEREQEAGACRIIKTGRIAGNIRDTEVENMDIVTCNYFMELAELEIKADTVNTQHGRYKSALGEIDGKYDFCIIDNPPDLGMNVINAMVAADEIIIPVCLDAYSLDGLEELVEQINQIRALNPKTRLAGVLITDYEKSDTSEAAKADEGTQKEIAQAAEDKGGLGAEEIKAMAEEKRHRKTKEEETREASVSDTDTTEEEKENARKLHAVKMIEKYYTWLNDEEVGILERMLEDCKRRKREYAIEEG